MSGGPLDVIIHPSATFDGDAASAAQFFALFQNLSGGETLEIEVEGIGSPGTPNQVVAYEIDAEVD